MPLTWREKHYGEEGARRFEVESRGDKFRAKSWDGARIGEYGSLEEAKKAVEDAHEAAPKATEAPQTAAEPLEAPKAPAAPADARQAPPRPATPPEPPKPAHGHAAHQPAHKGRR